MPGALPRGQPQRVQVAAVAAALDGLPAGATALVAVSGGADSAALALLARRARPDLQFVAVHVRHGLRDDAPDAAAAARVASTLDLPFVERAVTVRPRGEGVEAAAREARYAALRDVAGQRGAVAVLIGHTADDQAETVLLAIGRGTGTGGLGGMRPVRDEGGLTVVRPLLRLRRADVRAAAAAAGLPHVEDPTNADPGQRRRRAREEVLPALAGLSGGEGDPVGLLTRLADLARADADLLERLAADEGQRLVRCWGPVRCVRADEVRALPESLGRRVVRNLIAAVRGGIAGLDAEAVERALRLRAGGEVHVAGGVRITANGGWLAVAPLELADLAARPMAVPGQAALHEIGVTIHAEIIPPGRPAGPTPPPRPSETHPASRLLPPRAVLPRGPHGAPEAFLPSAARAGLTVRARRPGDPVPGAPHRRLGDRLTDLGVPRALRGLLPVIAKPDRGGGLGDPLWVPGIAVAAPPSVAAERVHLWVAPLR